MKKCKNCREPFTPMRTSLEKFCRKDECIKAMVKEAKEKVWKQTKQKMKADLMTVADYIKLAQQVFNQYIRLRDQGKPCISCSGKLGEKYDAGHFYSAGGHFSVRFDERNVSAQCVACNQHKHGNLLAYRDALYLKLGFEEFERLSADAMQTRKYTREELKKIINTYKLKIKLLKSEQI
jgi:hypothetical protein